MSIVLYMYISPGFRNILYMYISPGFRNMPERWPQVCRLKITFELLRTICFVSITTNLMKCVVKWIPLNTHIRFENTQPCLKTVTSRLPNTHMGNTLDGCCKCQDGTTPLKPEAEEMKHVCTMYTVTPVFDYLQCS